MPDDHRPSAGILEFVMELGERAANIVFPSRRTAQNLCAREAAALRDLHASTDHVFSVADKNLGLTAMYVDSYKAKCIDSLGKTHVLTTEPPDTIFAGVKRQLRVLYNTYVKDDDVAAQRPT